MPNQLEAERELQQIGQANSVQLFVVILMDTQRALDENTLDGNAYLMDNSFGSTGQGTTNLQTIVKPGQIVNWLIYSMDNDKDIHGDYPPLANINKILFLDKNRDIVDERRICTQFHRYGGIDRVRSPQTPVYYYWSGMLSRDLPADVYDYRFVVDIRTEQSFKRTYLNLDSPSLKLIPLHPTPADLE